MKVVKPSFTDAKSLLEGVIPLHDYHLHTSWTDGASSVEEMHQAALDVGLQAIVFSEHARKTSEDWFFGFVDQVRGLPKEVCRAFVGVEVKVESFEGALDTTDAIVQACDVVMASVHRFPGETGIVKGHGSCSPESAPDIELRLARAAIENPDTDILGHPFGMSYKRFGVEPGEELFRELIAHAAKYDVAFEINPQYHPRPRQLIEWCAEANAMVSLGSNAHTTDAVGSITRVLQGKEKPWKQ